MVIRYTKDGSPYRSPPYSRAEWEEMGRGLNDPPIYFSSFRRSVKPPQDQEPPGSLPANIRPDRKQP